jgi:hypothetical protein
VPIVNLGLGGPLLLDHGAPDGALESNTQLLYGLATGGIA